MWGWWLLWGVRGVRVPSAWMLESFCAARGVKDQGQWKGQVPTAPSDLRTPERRGQVGAVEVQLGSGQGPLDCGLERTGAWRLGQEGEVLEDRVPGAGS